MLNNIGKSPLYWLTASLVLIVSGCSSDGNERRQAYLDADYYTRLELPPDLTSPDNSKQLVAPAPDKEAIERFRKDSAHLSTVEDELPEQPEIKQVIDVKGAEFKVGDGLIWLEVDENANALWPKLKTFWDNEGVSVMRDEPRLGIIETDWTERLYVDKDAGLFSSFFSRVEADRLDKYVMRIEADGAVNKTRIYISHAGLEKFVEGDDINWVSRGSDDSLEYEILKRLSLYVGIDPQQFDAVYRGYTPYSSRIKLSSDESNVIYVKGAVDMVWNRTLRAVERMGFNIIEKNLTNHEAKVAVRKLEREDLGLEKDELAESSWLMQWLTGDGDATRDEGRQFILKHSDHKGLVRLEMLTVDRTVPESVLAEQFRDKLAKELR